MLKVGQNLYWVPRDARWGMSEREVTIEKVGRKWADIGSRIRINIETLCADGGRYVSPGRCYLSKSAFLAERELRQLWSELRKKIDCTPLPNITAEDIKQVMLLLKLEE